MTYTVNTTHGYTDDPREREEERQRILADRLAAARAEAERMCHSIKCANWYEAAKHRTEPDGCANDGRTCLCACHDGQRAWKIVPQKAAARSGDDA